MMYRVVPFLASFLLFTAAPGLAQVSSGVKAGVNFSNVSFDPEDEECCDPRVGFAVGLFTTVGVTDAVSFQPEFLYSMKGAKFSEGDEELKIDYFEIPLLLRADFTTSGNIRPFVLIGPSLGFKLNAKIDEDGEEVDIDDDVEGFDLGLAIGGGLQFGRGSIEARYTHGLSDADQDDESEARHRVFSVLVGYRF